MKELDMIREVFDKWLLELPTPVEFELFSEDPELTIFHAGYLAALSTIDPDAKKQETSEDAFDLVCKIREVKHGLDSSGDWVDYCVIDTHQAAALITAHDDAIRREAIREGFESGYVAGYNHPRQGD